MWQLLVGLAVGAVLLTGCGAGFGTAGKSGIGQYGDYPITDGFHHRLPRPGARTVVWGGHPSAVGTAITWLQRRGLRVVERSQLQKIFDEQRIQLTHSPDDEAQVLRVGKLLGAAVVVFLDTPISTGAHSSASGGFIGQYGGMRSDSATVYSTSIWIRGVNIETGEILWSATARYSESFANLDDVLARLTCHALATAWGFRLAGKPDNLPDMCMVGLDVSN